MRNKHVILAMALVAGLIFASASMPLVSAATIDHFEIDISTTENPVDFPYAIECSDTDFVWISLHNQGAFVQVNKTSFEAVDYFNDPKGAVAAGQDFYALAMDSDGRLYSNDKKYGLMWQYNPSSDTWDSAPLFEEITGNANVTYPDGYDNDPTLIRVDEDTHGFHTYDVGFNGWNTVIYVAANDHVYSALSYDVDFDSEGEAAGATDLSFAGLAKVNPGTMAVTWIPITGAILPASISIDSSDSSILWISDRDADKIFKFDVDTDSVIETISLAAGSTPLGMANDALFLYVALNKDALLEDPDTNSEVLKINKTLTSAQIVIDTGAPLDLFGTFTVFIANNLLLWTDQSQHVGSINLLDTTEKTFEDVGFAQSNHFGCMTNSTHFMWAGEGSAVLGLLDTTSITFDDDEEPETLPAEEIDSNPPSKKGLGLGIVFSCYYSHVNCELISTIEPHVIEWIKRTNAVESNPEVLTVLE